MSPTVFGAMAMGVVLGVLIGGLVWRRSGSSQLGGRIMIFVLVAALLVVAGGALLHSFSRGAPSDEIQMALMIVVAIATMMTLLFVLAAGFSSLQLADPKQALGLPEGSIRAMIALFLIMVFIVFGIFLFRLVGLGSFRFVGTFETKPNAAAFGEKTKLWIETKTIEVKDAAGNTDTKNQFDTWIVDDISDDGKRLAQQLVTTVGTLLVAVAGFYFGSTTFSPTAPKSAFGMSTPTIKSVTPESATKGDITLEINGDGFRSPTVVQLRRGAEIMSARDVLSSPIKIRATVTIDKEPDGPWDVLVQNDDGGSVCHDRAFTIT